MEESSDDTVSRLLEAVQAGDRSALDELYSLVYGELRVLAHRQRRRWDASGMLNTTALVHEAYLKLVNSGESTWKRAGTSSRSPRQRFDTS